MKTKKGRKPVVLDNSAVAEMLLCYPLMSDAPSWVDDIVNGASTLEMENNTRPVSAKKVYYMLMGLQEISTQSVQEALETQDDRYARRYAAILRFASSALYSEAVKRGEL